jgi:hypothetical protein
MEILSKSLVPHKEILKNKEIPQTKLPENLIRKLSELLPPPVNYEMWELFISIFSKYAETKEIGIEYAISYSLRVEIEKMKMI